jgi:hypothetical protein
MNPYLEQEDAWHDFHERFGPAVAEVLSLQVRPRYIVKIDEDVYIHEQPEGERRLLARGDVTLARSPGQKTPPTSGDVLEAPLRVRLPWLHEERLNFVEIRDRDSRQRITVLELLSPSNKRVGSDRELYLAKRTNLLKSSANFVEIDLLRGGARMPLEGEVRGHYVILVSRPAQRPEAEVWPVQLTEPLPEVPIPLRPGETDARLDLQAVLHRIYDAAGYEDYIYAHSPRPPLAPEEAAWAQQFLPVRT